MSDETKELIQVIIRGLKFTVSLLEKLLKVKRYEEHNGDRDRAY